MFKHLASFVKSLTGSSIFYSVCQIVKAYKVPFTSFDAKSDQPFDLLYIDLWTSPLLSCNNEKYFLSIVDDNTRFVWIFPLHTKSQVSFFFTIF